MKILAIGASSRRNGNSETLLDRALFSLNPALSRKGGAGKKGVTVKKVILTELDITACIAGCEACYKLGECVIKDDMQPLYKDLLTCDILLVASPVYFQGLPCRLKCVIDRCQSLWARRFVLKKPLTPSPRRGEGRGEGKNVRRGSAILVCASRKVKNTFTGSIITLRAWYHTLDISYKKEFLAEGLEQEAAALKDKKLLEKAVAFGKRLI